MEENLWIRGLFVGHDYIMTKDQLLDVRLVSLRTKVIIVAIPILVFLFAGGIFATSSFFVPVVVYPPLIEVIAHYKERGLKISLDIERNRLIVKKIKWSEVDRIQFEGGLFVISSNGGKQRLTSLTKYSNVSAMANYLRLTTKVDDITIRKVDWIYIFSSFFLFCSIVFIRLFANIALVTGVIADFIHHSLLNVHHQANSLRDNEGPVNYISANEPFRKLPTLQASFNI